MPVETQWLVNERIVYVRLYAQVTHEDLVISDLMVQALMDVATQTVHSIVDRTSMTTAPPLNMRAFVEMVRSLCHERQGEFVVVSQPDRLTDLFLYSVNLLTGVNATRAASLRAAMQLLAERDDSLPDLSAIISQFDE